MQSRTIALCVTAIAVVPHAYRTVQEPVPAIAYASFAPLNTDLFIANTDGSGAHALLPHPANDYNASFSADGRWIVFTSERNGSADLYRVHRDGTGLERLTDYIGFDDQAALSPDAKVLAFVSTRSGDAGREHHRAATTPRHDADRNDRRGDWRGPRAHFGTMGEVVSEVPPRPTRGLRERRSR